MALAREEFARRLVDARERRRLTQEQLAELAGVHPRQIIRWENQQSMPYFSNIEKLATALKIDPEQLTVDTAAPLGLRRGASLEQIAADVAALRHDVTRLVDFISQLAETPPASIDQAFAPLLEAARRAAQPEAPEAPAPSARTPRRAQTGAA